MGAKMQALYCKAFMAKKVLETPFVPAAVKAGIRRDTRPKCFCD